MWAAHLGLPAATLGVAGVGIAGFQAVAAGIPGPATIRAYDVLAAVGRTVPPLLPVLPRLLDFAWDTAEDPVG